MATNKQRIVAKLLLENLGMSVSEAMRKAGYSASYAKNPQYLTDNTGFKSLIGAVFDNPTVLTRQRGQLNAHTVDHMVFPLAMSDAEITELLAQANCMVKKFKHSETQTHVWFFKPDNTAVDKALDKIYKLRGLYAPEEHVVDAGWSLSRLFDQNEKRNVKK